jgi:lipopolysaccharide export system protein LptA
MQGNSIHMMLRAFFLSLLLACHTSFALSTDSQQPIHIQANSAERSEKNGTTIYEGEVIITQGSLKLAADKVVIYSKGDRVSHIIASGNPAHFEQQPNADDPVIHAEGNTIMYHLDIERIRLEESASLVREGSSVKGEQIDYFIAEEIVKAQGASGLNKKDHKPQERIEVVILPAKKGAE